MVFHQALKSASTTFKSPLGFTVLGSCISISLFLKAGFISTSMILFIFYCLINSNIQWRELMQENKVLFLPIILYFLYLIRFPGDNYTEALDLLVRKIPLLLLPVSFIVLKNQIQEKDVQIVLIVFLISCLICSLICYGNAVQNIITNKSFSIYTERQYYYFSFIYLTEPVNITPIYLSIYSNFALVIALKSTLIINRKLRLSIVLYLILFILLIASKIGIITLILILFIFILTKERKTKILKTLLILLIPFFIISIYSFPFLKERFTASLNFDYGEKRGNLWNSNSIRMAVWSCAISAVKEKPILGYGTANGQKALEVKYSENNFTWALFQSYNPHNEFLSTQLDLGMVGTLIVTLMMFLMFLQSLQSKNFIFIGLMLIIILSSLIESILLRQKAIVLFSFYGSLFLKTNLLFKKP